MSSMVRQEHVTEKQVAMRKVAKFLGKQGIKLQQLNKMFYKRIASYLFKYPMPIWKLVYKQLVQTQLWEDGVNEKTFPAKPTPDNQMVGIEHDGDEQTNDGWMFNMILKDGTRSDIPFTRPDGRVCQRYDYFLPQNNKITAVTIYYNQIIHGFRFHLSDGSNWDIGWIRDYFQTVTFDIADNEVIVGFNSKSYPDYPAWYVEWQFITAQGLRFN